MKIFVCKTKGCKKGAIIIADELNLPADISSIALKTGKQTYALFAAKPRSLTDCPRCGMPIAEAKEKPKPFKPNP